MFFDTYFFKGTHILLDAVDPKATGTGNSLAGLVEIKSVTWRSVLLRFLNKLLRLHQAADGKGVGRLLLKPMVLDVPHGFLSVVLVFVPGNHKRVFCRS